MVRWGAAAARPDHGEVRYSIVWTGSGWEGHGGVAVPPTDVLCSSFSLSPAARIAEVALASDLGSAEVGSLGVIGWATDLPPTGGALPKNYSGSSLVDGSSDPGALTRDVVSFPYPEGREADSRVEWAADLAFPEGGLRSGTGVVSLAGTSEGTIGLADLQPGGRRPTRACARLGPPPGTEPSAHVVVARGASGVTDLLEPSSRRDRGTTEGGFIPDVLVDTGTDQPTCSA